MTDVEKLTWKTFVTLDLQIGLLTHCRHIGYLDRLA